MEYLEKTEKLTALRKAIDTTIDQKEKIKLIQETAKILLEINAEKTKNLDKVIMLKEEESSYSAKEMEKIQVKNIISVKEYTEKYGDSDTSQKNDRGLIKNPLPYNQKVKNGKITYNVDEVEEWRAENAYKMAGKTLKKS